MGCRPYPAPPRLAAALIVLLALRASPDPAAATTPAGSPAPDSAKTAPELPPPGPPLAFERCSPDTNLGCNPVAVPGVDSMLRVLSSLCGPVFVRAELADSSADRVRVRTLRYTASDGCGHTATCTRTITWTEDRVAPVLPHFTDTTLAHDANRCTAALALPARAPRPGADSVAIRYTPPAPFPIGVTRVMATATDECGNADRDSFVVTVTTEICGARFYDANGNGMSDDRGEIVDWPVTLIGTTANGPVGPLTARTGADGRYCFRDLLPGSYQVTTKRNAGTAGSAPDTVAFPKLGKEGGCPAVADFGEFCIGRGGGAPLGSWTVASAQKVMGDGGGPVPEFEELSALCLRNPDGTDFNPTSAARFRSWLQSSETNNMAYLLSVQLATLYLNVEAGLVSGSAIVATDGCGNRGPAGRSILVNDLLAVANAELCTHGLAGEGSPYRERQACLRAALEGVNADRGFVLKSPCTAPAGAPVQYHPTERK